MIILQREVAGRLIELFEYQIEVAISARVHFMIRIAGSTDRLWFLRPQTQKSILDLVVRPRVVDITEMQQHLVILRVILNARRAQRRAVQT